MSLPRPSLRARLVGAALLAAAACRSTPAPSVAAVSLSAEASKATYLLGEPIQVSLRLRNDADSPTALSSMSHGTVTVVSLSRDGRDVASRETTSKFDQDLGVLLRESRLDVAPGQAVTVQWRSFDDPMLQGQCLGTVQYRPDANPTTIHLIGLPGQYELTVKYEFPQAAARAGEVVRNPAAPVTVRFAVSP